ncbi:hypothetical protein [Ammoniphilus sp. 3BR4]|uniref:hypothetical protein n=1 Tax=Ammoniphilus sp. 3BR4 TaxID=3158265 RepID=UPI00346590FE
MEKIIQQLTSHSINLEKVIREAESNRYSKFRQDLDWMRGVVEGIKQSIKLIKEEMK